uniref:Secreted protein n=1 Tax=Plectus sambesii TaxID=2011161 RepID=A0A914VFS7_9BILA
MSITTVDIVIQSIFLGFALLQLAQAYCNCGELTSCMTRAWQPCWTGKDQQAMVLGMQLFPVDVERSGCPYEWKRLRGLDPTYTHWKSIMNCQTKRKVYATTTEFPIVSSI